MKTYIDGFKDTMVNGFDHSDRTGVGRRSVFGRQYRFDLTKGFPLVTTKKVSIDNIIKETLWFISGSQRSLDLEEMGVNIWKQWTPTQEDATIFIDKIKTDFHKNGTKAGIPDLSFDMIDSQIRSRVGTVGPLYGAVWRGKYSDGYRTSHPDQIANLIDGLIKRPYHSRHCVTAWIPHLLPNPDYTPKENVLMGLGALAPCHCFFQCFVTPPQEDTDKKRLSLNIVIRSSDTPIGQPYNIAQYSILLMMLAQVTGMQAHELIVTVGDQHVYLDQLDLALEQIKREPYELPTLTLNSDVKNIDDFKFEDFKLTGYKHHPFIKYPVAT
jgi:thymidylate synthase